MAWTSPRTWVTGETPTAAIMNTHIRDNLDAILPDGDTADSWTPALEAASTSPSISAATGRQYQVGILMHVWARFLFDSGSMGSGAYFVTLPVAASGLFSSSASGSTIGSVECVDSSSGTSGGRIGIVRLRAADEASFVVDGSPVTAAAPFTWAAGNEGVGDVLTFHAAYPVA